MPNPYDLSDQSDETYPMYRDGIDPDEERKKWAMEALDSPNGVLPDQSTPPDPTAKPMSMWRKLAKFGQVFAPGLTGNAGQGTQSPQQQQMMNQSGGGGYDPYGTGQALGSGIRGLSGAISDWYNS